jgi:hypothetical protein
MRAQASIHRSQFILLKKPATKLPQVKGEEERAD